MNSVTAILVDDEEHNLNTLRSLLTTHCPLLHIAAEASSAEEAFILIRKIKPKIVFLDVMMPEKSGFDLLKMFSHIDFEVIFVSAFNEFAVTAFDYNALGYILKPIDYNKLTVAVNKALTKINTSVPDNNVIQFIKTLDPHSDKIAKIALHHNEKVILVSISDVISLKSSDKVTHIYLSNGEHYFSSRELKLFNGIFKENESFVRISKSTIVNLEYIKSYQKGDVCVLKMINDMEFEVSRRKKTEILQRLRLI